jgi:hypothetical protein
VKAKKRTLLVAASAQQIKQGEEYPEQTANRSAREGVGGIALFCALALHKDQPGYNHLKDSGRLTTQSFGL